MRVIAGKYRGQRLHQPRSDAIRPTTDRNRESLFNILEHGVKDIDFEDIRVLDLFSGTGALGIEALSRGAGFCLFVDDNAAARALVRQNIEKLNLTGITKIFRRNATRLGTSGRFGQFDLIFCDPPYGQDLGVQAIASALEGGWVRAGAILVLEEQKDAVIEDMPGLDLIDQRIFGETQYFIFRSSYDG
ncbi:MAG: 16S rRNA (guanine(966)-N(2))-methyltransferase RsmD [Methyloligellaceae bacterium]